ncbi:polyprenyl synthetase family protein [Erysipelothrix sp. HDW6B]|uniref:polyprenyl synthetase family protein n=1 Tax=Erysipelothrix TaxID=1647 RepID=UPI00140BAD5B|nr:MULTISPECIES: polyprenyl synthetase family protein [Erysipelothrix]QIK85479.1 polyprenyl synthetase family protein [Erysipelothrix sp. HDW6B]
MNIFEEYLEYVKREVGVTISTSPLIVRKYIEHLLKSEGKYIRAAAVLAAAQNKDGTIHHDAVIFAASIELLHLATLVHDDVMDDADTRRGVTTLHKKYGRKTAVICGDYLMAASMSLANKTEKKETYLGYSLPTYMEAIALGELNQHINNGNYKLKVKDYLSIIDGKTAKLFEAAMYSGVATSDDVREQQESYQTIGHAIGMIFQLLDDVMDFDENESVAKKPVQSDFEQGVITLPLIHAFSIYPEALIKAEQHALTRNEVNQYVRNSKGVAITIAKAETYYATAKTAIENLDIIDTKREELMRILNLAMRK